MSAWLAMLLAAWMLWTDRARGGTTDQPKASGDHRLIWVQIATAAVTLVVGVGGLASGLIVAQISGETQKSITATTVNAQATTTAMHIQAQATTTAENRNGDNDRTRQQIDKDIAIKRLDITFEEKLKRYVRLMTGLSDLEQWSYYKNFDANFNRPQYNIFSVIREIETKVNSINEERIAILVFMSADDRSTIDGMIQEFLDNCKSYAQNRDYGVNTNSFAGSDSEMYGERARTILGEMKPLLIESLFAKESGVR
jgi:hypothetical protein